MDASPAGNGRQSTNYILNPKLRKDYQISQSSLFDRGVRFPRFGPCLSRRVVPNYEPVVKPTYRPVPPWVGSPRPGPPHRASFTRPEGVGRSRSSRASGKSRAASQPRSLLYANMHAPSCSLARLLTFSLPLGLSWARGGTTIARGCAVRPRYGGKADQESGALVGGLSARAAIAARISRSVALSRRMVRHTWFWASVVAPSRSMGV